MAREAQPDRGAEGSPAHDQLIGRRSARLRLRAAWMYYAEEMTQNAIAEALGVGRVTVARLLADARALHEVNISLSGKVAELPRLENALERRFNLTEAVVAPLSSPDADPTSVIGAATGRFISEFVKPDMQLGVGWGRTLLNSLAFVDPRRVQTVVSLLGGILAVKQHNPAEFAWQFARLFGADCYLIPAPAVVDSIETKRALIERCGIDEIFRMSESLDAVLLSVGGIATSTAHTFGYTSQRDNQRLAELGAVGNVLYNFFDATGRLVEHPLNQRVMSVPVANLVRTPRRILTSGGRDKVAALGGAIALLHPTILITDEVTARALLGEAEHGRDDPDDGSTDGRRGEIMV